MKYVNGVFVVLGIGFVLHALSATYWAPSEDGPEPLAEVLQVDPDGQPTGAAPAGSSTRPASRRLVQPETGGQPAGVPSADRRPRGAVRTRNEGGAPATAETGIRPVPRRSAPAVTNSGGRTASPTARPAAPAVTNSRRRNPPTARRASPARSPRPDAPPIRSSSGPTGRGFSQQREGFVPSPRQGPEASKRRPDEGSPNPPPARGSTLRRRR